MSNRDESVENPLLSQMLIIQPSSEDQAFCPSLESRIAKYLRSRQNIDPECASILQEIRRSVSTEGGVLQIDRPYFEDKEVLWVANVDSTQNYWHAGTTLEPNARYSVTPSKTSRWTLNVNRRRDGRDGLGNLGYSSDDDGIGWEFKVSHDRVGTQAADLSDGSIRGSDKYWVHLGFVYVLEWRRQADGSNSPLVTRLKRDGFEFTASPHGGSLLFYIADIAGDNSGVCRVTVTKV